MDKNTMLEIEKLIDESIVETTKFKESLLNRQFEEAQKHLHHASIKLELIQFIKDEA